MATAGRKIVLDSWKVYMGKAEVYPVVACIGAAVGWCAYMSGRHLFTSPDVSFDRERRGSPLKDVVAEAETWKKSHRKHIAKDVSQIKIFSSFDKKYA